MAGKHKPERAVCPVTVDTVRTEARQQFEELLDCCQQSACSFWEFEKHLRDLLAALACVLVRLFLTAWHRRLELQPYLQTGTHRLGDSYAERRLKTAYGTVTYGRAHLIHRHGGHGFHPLDAVLGLTRDHFSPGLMQLVARLATRLSYPATRLVCQAVLGWSPATEAIEQVVLGLGRQAAPFVQQQAAPPDDGDVLVNRRLAHGDQRYHLSPAQWLSVGSIAIPVWPQKHSQATSWTIVGCLQRIGL